MEKDDYSVPEKNGNGQEPDTEYFRSQRETAEELEKREQQQAIERLEDEGGIISDQEIEDNKNRQV